MHFVKSLRIWSFSDLHFPIFGPNTDTYSISLRIQSECKKTWTRKTPHTDTFHAVMFCTCAHRIDTDIHKTGES